MNDSLQDYFLLVFIIVVLALFSWGLVLAFAQPETPQHLVCYSGGEVIFDKWGEIDIWSDRWDITTEDGEIFHVSANCISEELSPK